MHKPTADDWFGTPTGDATPEDIVTAVNDRISIAEAIRRREEKEAAAAGIS